MAAGCENFIANFIIAFVADRSVVWVFLTANRYSSGPFAPELVSVNVASCVASPVKSPGRVLDGAFVDGGQPPPANKAWFWNPSLLAGASRLAVVAGVDS